MAANIKLLGGGGRRSYQLAQSVKGPTPALGSHHDLRMQRSSPRAGSLQSTARLVPLPLLLPLLLCVCSSLTLINKQKVFKKNPLKLSGGQGQGQENQEARSSCGILITVVKIISNECINQFGRAQKVKGRIKGKTLPLNFNQLSQLYYGQQNSCPQSRDVKPKSPQSSVLIKFDLMETS